MPALHVLIKPASNHCNLRCRYCFYFDLSSHWKTPSHGIMSLSTLETVVKESLSFADGVCTFLFQGGEPTLVGLPFFQKLIDFEKKYNFKNIKIFHTIQTNGTTLTEEWAEFFRKNDFLVGISLDGPQKLHDTFRTDSHCKGSFHTVMRGIDCLRRNHVEFNILTVINSSHLPFVKEIYSFFKKEGFFHLQFIPCLNPIEDMEANKAYSLSPKGYGDFLCELFNLWFQDLLAGREIHIRQFENYVTMLLGYPPESCGMSGVCSFQNVVEADGSVYPCDFYVLDHYRLGNLTEDSFDSIYAKRKEIRFLENSRPVPTKCKACPYLFICRGGCFRYRIKNAPEQIAHNYYCDSFFHFFEQNLPKLHFLANAFRR